MGFVAMKCVRASVCLFATSAHMHEGVLVCTPTSACCMLHVAVWCGDAANLMVCVSWADGSRMHGRYRDVQEEGEETGDEEQPDYYQGILCVTAPPEEGRRGGKHHTGPSFVEGSGPRQRKTRALKRPSGARDGHTHEGGPEEPPQKQQQRGGGVGGDGRHGDEDSLPVRWGDGRGAGTPSSSGSRWGEFLGMGVGHQRGHPPGGVARPARRERKREKEEEEEETAYLQEVEWRRFLCLSGAACFKRAFACVGCVCVGGGVLGNWW